MRASRPGGVLANQVWIFLALFPVAFFLVGAVDPSWVYGTPLNLEFSGQDAFQIAAIFLWAVGAALAFWTVRTLGRFMVIEIEVRSDHELVTTGPYARVRHPAYTAFLIMDGAAFLLFFNVVLIATFAARLAIATLRARGEEELLRSEAGFGDRYGDYMVRTGRFLPRLRKP